MQHWHLMELTAERAKEIAQHAITKAGWDGNDAIVVDEYTQEFDVGWVFYYQSARFLETGEFGFSLVGNAPFFVSRLDGYTAFISYLRPIVESIEAFRACGDANAYQVGKVRLTGWLPGADRVEAIQLVRKFASLSLEEAKQAVDCCLASQNADIETSDVASAKDLVARLAEIGFLSAVVYRSAVA